MSILKKFVKCILFVIIFVFLFIGIQRIFREKWLYEDSAANATTSCWMEFENLEENSIDMLFLGTSHLLYGIDPMYLYGKTGITSYIISGPGTRMDMTYYSLLHVLEKQSPRLIFLDVASLQNMEAQTEAYIHKTSDELPLSEYKLEYAMNHEHDDLTFLEVVFPFFRYHSRWSELREEDFLYAAGELEETFVRGHHITYKSKKAELLFEEEMEFEISQRYLAFLEKIVNLCREKNITLILGKIPSPEWNQTVSDVIAAEADRLGVTFWDFTYNVNEIGIDVKKDFTDKEDHMNQYGAEKMTDYILTCFSSLMSFEDKRGMNPEWDEDYAKYQEHVAALLEELAEEEEKEAEKD